MIRDILVVALAVCLAGLVALVALVQSRRARRAAAGREAVGGARPRPTRARPRLAGPAGVDETGGGTQPGSPAPPEPETGPDPKTAPEPQPEPEPSRESLHAQARELAAHASAAEGRAERAAEGVEAARVAYGEAEADRAAIEAEYDEARVEYADVLRAVRAGQPAPQREPERVRRREVESAALAAYRRGELSIDELRAVFARTGERDPAREALAHRAERLAAREGEIRRRYDIAAAAARVAGERRNVAEVAAAAIVQEAVDAAMEAQVAADELERS